jgi:hypothetical protein
VGGEFYLLHQARICWSFIPEVRPDKLTLADLNEEGANLVALQTR